MIEMALFMTLMESTIVSTSVVTITNDLGGYVEISWIFTSYLLSFSGENFLHSPSISLLTLMAIARVSNHMGQSFRYRQPEYFH
ncbi:hypothetical protein BS50DRAFT_267800 [Corynespora cassiicola Philippines]|uniref:Uncharacterized protein n=1 Tax=Corynespora cassiicola Philippines TaxID=1448308 RepID=A0A2T2NZD9_CORCC|nr:hypothetical protein BS50DRAFT_267800 [Corynespora cassiicola Philippines]